MNKRSELLEKMDELVELLGSEFVVENIALYMSTDDLEDCLKHIDRNCETNVFYEGSYISNVEDWTGKIIKSFEFEEYGEDCEFEAILYKEELSRDQAIREWAEDQEKCIKDGYNSVEELENAISEDLYIYSYDKEGKSIPVNFG